MKDHDQYWRSLNELEETPEFAAFVEREFSEAAFDPPDAVGRRRFMQIMGASFALAVGGCWEKEEILPFTRRPEGFVPGRTKSYRTAFELGGSAIGLSVTSIDGRPIKIEGNPDHPFSRGGTNSYAQASVLELYDPDRSTRYSRKEGTGRAAADRAAFVAALREARKKAGDGKNLYVLASPSSSPTLARLKKELLEALPQASWVEYTTFSNDNERAGLSEAFGEAVRADYDFEGADVILTLDADPLNDHPAAMKLARQWAKRRDPKNKLNRLYAVESILTATGASADHRLALRAAQVGPFAAWVAAEAGKGKTGAPQPPSGGALADPRVAKFATAVAADIAGSRGGFVVVPGQRQPATVHALAHWLNASLGAVGKTVVYRKDPDGERPAHGQALADLVAAMSARKVQTLVILGENPVYQAPGDVDFAAALGGVENVFHVGLYDDETAELAHWHAPAKHYLTSWGDARTWDGTYTMQQPLMRPLYGGMSALEVVAELAGQQDPDERQLVRQTFSETHGVALGDQPRVEPPKPDAVPTLDGAGGADERAEEAKPDQGAGGAAATAVGGAAAAGGASAAQEGGAAPQPPEGQAGEGGGGAGGAPVATADDLRQGPEGYEPLSAEEKAWMTALHDGYVKDSAFEPVEVSPQGVKVALDPESGQSGLDNGKLEIVFFDDGKVHDGRFANNAWLQETPESRSKLTWDNALYVSPTTAEALGVRDEDLVKVQVGQAAVDLPVIVLPGQPTGSVAVALGYGRRRAGVVGGSEAQKVAVGFDVRALRSTDKPFFAGGVTVNKAGGSYPLAATQDHHAIDPLGGEERERRARLLIRNVDAATYAKNPEVVAEMDHHPPLVSLFNDLEYSGARWAMSIDLNKCTGCAACVVACTSENNVPVVGKKQVRTNREMHWIRVDRYFKGDPENPEVAYQPLPCMQCENAPCEQVCPVGATVHSNEGLNDMVYNRCIGTRYCSNNCPYKVRRFNFHHWNEDLKDPKNQVKLMVINPDVTVRGRGVMEKCTYCVQRIQHAKHDARIEGRGVRDGDITPACAQACPTEAIVFGDLRDPKSRVSKLHAEKRTYSLLQDLNNRPRTRYMARITNPNPALERA
jgi:MoCo/4Fe-4S cofactor protein with predicted Tat translocation signal